MRSPLRQVAVPILRGLHTARAQGPRLRCFHQPTVLSLPRKRTFFSSNQLLSAGEKPEISENNEDGKASQALSSTSTKRKPLRSSAAKSLRLASMTKPTKRTTSKTRPEAEVDENDDTDFHRTISAICVAQSFDMDQVQDILRLHAFELDPDGTEFDTAAVVHARSVNNGDIFVFPSGTIVAWSVPNDSVVALATKQLIRAADLPHVDRLENEKLEFIPDETRDTSFMKGEVVILGTRAQELHHNRLDTTLAKIAFSSGLARSPKLAVLETNLSDYFDHWKTTLDVLAPGSEPKLKRSSVLKMTGQLLSLRSQLNHYSDITEELPDMFWDSESRLEEYYNQMGTALAIRQRISILNKRIDYAHESVSVLREMVSEKSGHRLEWIIIYLITVEVMFELRRVWREYKEETKREANAV
ncbi:hypothetical protein F4780DRAFT_769266 [Xylariomycetidae sp. FL0641]|nr:hypothetical protein F4780DRAFT_769266 [Xylariomycetidae sp. FL0641]